MTSQEKKRRFKLLKETFGLVEDPVYLKLVPIANLFHFGIPYSTEEAMNCIRKNVRITKDIIPSVNKILDMLVSNEFLSHDRELGKYFRIY